MKHFTRRSLTRAAQGVAACLLLAGCNSTPQPAPSQWQGPQAAMETLAQRSRAVRSVSAACGLTLASGSGDAVNLDGAIAAQMSENGEVRLRLRTWKIAQAVFDITVTPEGVWLATSGEAAKRSPSGPALNPEQIARGWSLFMGGFFAEPGATLIDDGGETFSVKRRANGGVEMVATVDRGTLLPTEYRITGPKGEVLQTLRLSRYREAAPGLWWPMRIEAAGPDGRIEVRLEDVELNTPLEQGVFTPPRRAVKQEAPSTNKPAAGAP